MLDSIVDVRTPRILLILRNAYGGAYASYNNYPTGADLVLALPTTRLAVMGPAGKEFVYKDEVRKMRAAAADDRIKHGVQERIAAGMTAGEAKIDAEKDAADWLKIEEGALNLRYEKELMNPKEGLALGLDLFSCHAHRPAQGTGGEHELPPASLQAGTDAGRSA